MHRLAALVLALLMTLTPSSRGAQDLDRIPPPLKHRKTAALGIGLAPPSDWSTAFPFVDFMKQSRPWYDWEQDAAVTTVDEHGWLTSLPAGARAGTVFLTNESGSVPYPRLVVRWQGRGDVAYDWAARRLGAAPGGGDLVECGRGSCLLRIDRVDPRDPIRNITIVPEQHVAAFDAGAVFNPDYVARLRPLRAVRFMDWMRTNETDQVHWRDRPRARDRTWAPHGVPVEVMIQLANTLDADAWFNVPHTATDDYVTRLAEKIRDGLAPHVLAYVEHSNEVWNWSFPQADFAVAAARDLWGADGDAFMQWHGMRTARICDVFKRDVFGDQSSRVRCVLGTQAGWRDLEQPALHCPLWVAQGNAPCYAHGIDALAITSYVSGCLAGDPEDPGPANQMRSWFDDPDGGLTRGFEQLRDARHFDCGFSLNGTADTVSYFKRVADSLGLSLVAYEAGQHVTSNGLPTQDDSAFVALHVAMNRDPRMGDLYRDNLREWRERGGTLFMHYSDITPPTKWGSWGALESITQATSPKWDALSAVNAEPCWWPGCEADVAAPPGRGDGPHLREEAEPNAN